MKVSRRNDVQLLPNGLSNRINRLLTRSGFTVDKTAIAIALRTGKLYPGLLPLNYGLYAHRDVCRWAGVEHASLKYPSHDYERFPDNGLSYRTNKFLKFTGIPATKAAVVKSLKNGDLTPTKRPIGYGKGTHAELCRWVLGRLHRGAFVVPSGDSSHGPPSVARPGFSAGR